MMFSLPTKEQTLYAANVMRRFAEGEPIECYSHGMWVSCTDPVWNWEWNKYRIAQSEPMSKESVPIPRPTDCADIREGRVTVLARDQDGNACMTMVKHGR